MMREGGVYGGTSILMNAACQPTHQEVLNQLERITRSIHFRNSKRYPTLLRFVVERTLDGEADQLKERTLGVEVFGRRPDYDTNSDPVVRFTAAEIRKRIAQYYMAPEHEHELRFELPLGTYIPQFLPPHGHAVQKQAESAVAATTIESGVSQQSTVRLPYEEPVAAAYAAPEDEHPSTGPLPAQQCAALISLSLLRRYLLAASLLLLIATLALTYFVRENVLRRRSEAGTSKLWQPLLATKGTCMIVLGVHSFDTDGKDQSPASSATLPARPKSMLASMLHSEMVPVSDVVSYGYLTNLLTRNNHAYTTRSASAITFDQIRSQPAILVGGFDNIWTIRLTANLRYRFAAGDLTAHAIIDSQHPQTRWIFDSGQSSLSTSEDFGVVSEFFDPQIEQNVIVIAGIGKDGTEAAAEFATTSSYLASGVNGQTSSHLNYEVVVSTQIIDGQHGPPHVVASYTW